MDEKQAQLEWERRAGKIAAVGSLMTAAFIVAAIAYRIIAIPTGANNEAQLLPQVEAHKVPFEVYGVLTGLGMLCFIIPLSYLYIFVKFRRPELPKITRALVIIGPILVAIAAIWGPFRQVHAADQFVAGTIKTKKHAQDLISHSTTGVAAISLPAAFISAIGIVLLNVNAMRAGLLSRFMGVLGCILGGLFVIPLAPVPVIQLFWVTALGALFLGIWPGDGRGPAWDSGEAEPWPPAQRRFAAPPAADGDDDAAPDEPEEEAAATPNPRASRKRKKRKARR